jgi:pyrroline-5-carboxylate reductase
VSKVFGQSRKGSKSSKRHHQHYTLGVIGAGVMGGALTKGIVSAKVVEPARIVVFDVDRERMEQLCTATGAGQAKDNVELVQRSQVVLVAVKPQVLEAVLRPLHDNWREDHLLVSIVAGVTIERLKTLTRADMPVARVMPNVLCTVQAGVCGVAFSEEVPQPQRHWVKEVLGAVGVVVEIEERLMDAVTGLSGSGPAFVAAVIEALADGGVAAGLSRGQAIMLAAQTVMGTGKYVLDSGDHPGQLKDRVCSPGGATIAGIRALESGRLRSTLMEAVLQAVQRSRELGLS